MDIDAVSSLPPSLMGYYNSSEIVDYYKPFYKPWKKVMKNLEKYLQIFSDNFDNPQIVTQHRLSFSGFTKAGLQKIQEIKDKINL